MLYATTRSKTNSYTDYRALLENRSPDDGFFLPFRMQKLTDYQLTALKEQPFGQTIAYILNIFFPGRITSWDVDCCIGKRPADIISVKHRVFLAKLWDNPMKQYGYLCDQLYGKLCQNASDRISNWAYIAIRIAVLFGIWGILPEQPMQMYDICVSCGDFSDPMAAWYARYMGLPIGEIICACNEHSPVWDFIHRGELDTGAEEFIKKDLFSPLGLERLIFSTLGYEQTQKYLQSVLDGGVYRILPEQLKLLSQGMFISVVGADRAGLLKSAFGSSNHYQIDSATASAYGALQDYRSRKGESKPTVLLWDFAQ